MTPDGRAAGQGDDRLPLRRRLRPARDRAVLRSPASRTTRPRTRSTRSPTSRWQTEAGVSNQFSEQHRRRPRAAGRRQLRLRIGDPDETIDTPTATYVITYDVAGAMRTFPHATTSSSGTRPGFDGTPPSSRLSITAQRARRRPGRSAASPVRPSSNDQRCTRHDQRRTGSPRSPQTNIAAGEGVTIGVKITSGLIANNKPHPRTRRLQAESRRPDRARSSYGAVTVAAR